MDPEIEKSIFPYIHDGITAAVEDIARTWRPDDPAYRADVYRQIMMNLSYSYFAFFHADAEHPDWAPLWNPVYTDQPNPDDIYVYAPIRGDLRYRVSGNRGTCALVTFNTQRGWTGMVESQADMGFANDFDDRNLVTDANGDFEIIFSAERPAKPVQNWAPIAREATAMVLRYRMVDWEKERDPQLSIECLDTVPLKPRLTPEQIVERIRQMSMLPTRYNASFYRIQNSVKERVGVNMFVQERYPGGGLSKQVYWPAVFELEEGEALIVETEMPEKRHYWNIQINDPYFNAVEYVYRLASINEATARFSSDGKLRVVVSLEDPGVPNWLDPGGFKQGTIYGRWYDTDTSPLATIKRVPLAELREHLPTDTPSVSTDERADEIRRRLRAAQLRRRW